MDRIAAEILKQELLADADVLCLAVTAARQRIEEDFPGSLPACGYELNRTYNILEKGFERICEAFENHFEKRGAFHEKLIERMRLDLPGIRPAFLPADQVHAVRELKGFRHVFRHAYDLTLLPDRLIQLVQQAEQVADGYTRWIESFVEAIGPHLEEA
ncbi:MAG: hypothetical protein R3C59_24355 [Planctomycetaceae bacterium]